MAAASYNELMGLGSHPANPSVLGDWPLQESFGATIEDQSGKGNHGTTDVLNTRVGPTSYLSSAYDFSPLVEQEARLPASGFVAGTGPREYSWWHYIDGPLESYQVMLDAGGLVNGYALKIDAGRYRLMHSGVSGRTGLSPTTGEWVLFSVSYPGEGGLTAIRMYVDGVQIATTAGNPSAVIDTVFDYPSDDPQARLGNAQRGGEAYGGGMAGLLSFHGTMEPSERQEHYHGPEPVNTVPPVITAPSGSAIGDTLQVGSPGIWDSQSNGTIAYTYRWYRDGEIIDGATADAYTLQAVDYGTTIHAEVLASNDGGSDPSQWTASNAIEVEIIEAVILPTLAINQDGTWTGTLGTWSGEPTSYAWELRRSADDSVVDSGATSVAGAVLVGSGLSVGNYYLWVEASNSGESGVGVSGVGRYRLPVTGPVSRTPVVSQLATPVVSSVQTPVVAVV